MKVKLNRRTIQVFEGAQVKHALLKYFTEKKLNKDFIDQTEVHDAEGHVIDHDAPLTENQKITFEEPQP